MSMIHRARSGHPPFTTHHPIPGKSMPPGENPLLRSPLSRRRFLALGGGLAATATLGAACSSRPPPAPPPRVGPHSPAVTAAARARQVPGAPTVNVALEAAPAEIDLGAGTRVSTWAFGGQLPGKEIRTKKGDVLRVDLSNTLPQDTTIHWHGLAIRNDMDGVPALTQDPIKAGANFRASSPCRSPAPFGSTRTSGCSWTGVCTPR